jgi:hypothetical protein
VSEYGERDSKRERHRENEERQRGGHASAAQLVLEIELVGNMLLVGLLQALDLPRTHNAAYISLPHAATR